MTRPVLLGCMGGRFFVSSTSTTPSSSSGLYLQLFEINEQQMDMSLNQNLKNLVPVDIYYSLLNR